MFPFSILHLRFIVIRNFGILTMRIIIIWVTFITLFFIIEIGIVVKWIILLTLIEINFSWSEIVCGGWVSRTVPTLALIYGELFRNIVAHATHGLWLVPIRELKYVRLGVIILRAGGKHLLSTRGSLGPLSLVKIRFP